MASDKRLQIVYSFAIAFYEFCDAQLYRVEVLLQVGLQVHEFVDLSAELLLAKLQHAQYVRVYLVLQPPQYVLH